jgi:PAS domain S-box-containing protein
MNEETKTKQQLIDELKSIHVRLAEAEQSESQEILKQLMVAILDAIPLAVFGMKERRIIFANHGVETVFGWQPDELVGQSTRILYRSDEDYEEIARRFYPVLERQRTHIDEFPCRRKDEQDIICLVSASRIGELLTERMIVVTYEDVSSRKRAEQELREYRGYLEKLVDVRTKELEEVNEQLRNEIAERKQAEELYKTMAEQSITAVFIVQEGVFRFINAKAISYAGYTPEELIGKDVSSIIHLEDREMVREKTRDMLKGVDTTPCEYRVVTKQGQIKWVMQTLTSIQYEGKRAFLGNAMDISDRKRVEEEQRRLEKLQGVLEIAGTVCHEMNQPMQIISGYTELLLRNTSEDDPVYEKLNTIKNQIFRMAAITKKLMMIRDYEYRDYAGISRIIDIHGEDIERSEKKV